VVALISSSFGCSCRPPELGADAGAVFAVSKLLLPQSRQGKVELSWNFGGSAIRSALPLG
jgi:hypothetical protein